MTKTLSGILLCLVLAPAANANLDIHLSGGALGGSVQIELIGDAGETYLIFVSDDPNNLIKWSDITINTPGFISALNGSGLASATLPLPGAKVLDGFQLYFQAVTVTGPPYVVDDSSPVCQLKLGESNGIVTSNAALTSARTNAAIAELPDGRVLIAGGGGGPIFSPVSVTSADIYDPCTDSVTASAGTMSNERAFHTLTPLQNGQYLVAGGSDSALAINTSADIYDPVTDTFTPTGALATARMGHSATLLDDGRVLVAGGTNTLLPDYLAFLFGNALSTEIWDPNTGTFSAGPNLDNGAKMFHTATRLNNGNILFAGGFSITFISGFGVAEITNRMSVYDQQTNSFIANPFRIGGRPRAAHSAVLLDDGRVLLAGGASQPVETAPTTRGVDVYDPVVDNGAAVADMSRSRGMFPMFKLNDGRVVALGGVIGDFTNTGATNRIDIYDPVLDTWTDTMGITDMLSTPRAASSGIRLSTGRILVIGGQDGNDTPQLSAELFLQ